MSELALLGGHPVIDQEHEELFHWPIVTEEDEAAVLDVLRRGVMSGTDVTRRFEEAFAAWLGMPYALGFCNGTMAIYASFYACGVGEGDEVVCPSITYWASCTSLLSMGATPVFADVDPDTLCIDPADIERCIGPRTKAILVVHYAGYPCDMDPIMEIAGRHGLYVIEDVSHAQGGLYKGRRLGTIGDIAPMSLMGGKSFAIGEGGILVTRNQTLYERAIAFTHYERNNEHFVRDPALAAYYHLPHSGMKGRMNQTCSAMGLTQLKYYDERCAEIRRAINRFWDLLEGVPGLRAHRADERAGSNMAGWYAARWHYRPEELGGLSVTRFCEAVEAEGAPCSPGANAPLHTHPLFQTFDIYHAGKPTRIAHTARDVRALDRPLPVSEGICARLFAVPWFKHDRPDVIAQYAEAFAKVARNYRDLLPGDTGDGPLGQWFFYAK